MLQMDMTCKCYGLPSHFVPKVVDFKKIDGAPLVLQMAVRLWLSSFSTAFGLISGIMILSQHR